MMWPSTGTDQMMMSVAINLDERMRQALHAHGVTCRRAAGRIMQFDAVPVGPEFTKQKTNHASMYRSKHTTQTGQNLLDRRSNVEASSRSKGAPHSGHIVPVIWLSGYLHW